MGTILLSSLGQWIQAQKTLQWRRRAGSAGRWDIHYVVRARWVVSVGNQNLRVVERRLLQAHTVVREGQQESHQGFALVPIQLRGTMAGALVAFVVRSKSPALS